jgi:hypothetical protein
MLKLLLEVGADEIGESPQVVRNQGMIMCSSSELIADRPVWRCDDVDYTAGERYPTIDGTSHSYQA